MVDEGFGYDRKWLEKYFMILDLKWIVGFKSVVFINLNLKEKKDVYLI